RAVCRERAAEVGERGFEPLEQRAQGRDVTGGRALHQCARGALGVVRGEALGGAREVVGEPLDVRGVAALERLVELVEPRRVLREEALRRGDQQVAVPFDQIQGALQVECRSLAVHTPPRPTPGAPRSVSRDRSRDLTRERPNWAIFPILLGSFAYPARS